MTEPSRATDGADGSEPAETSAPAWGLRAAEAAGEGAPEEVYELEPAPVVRRRRSWPVVVTAAVVAVLIAAVAGVALTRGGDEGYALSASDTATKRAKTITFEATVSGDGQALTMNGRMDNVAGTIASDALIDGKTFAMIATTKPYVMYIDFKALGLSGDALPARWGKVTAEAMAKESGVDFGALASSGTTDPTSNLALYAKARAEVVGFEEVGGVRTKHYRTHVSMREVLQKSGAVRDQAKFDEMIAELGDDQVVDVWVDADNQVRKTASDMSFGDQGTMRVEYRFTGFDVPIDPIVIPAEADTFDLAKLAQQVTS